MMEPLGGLSSNVTLISVIVPHAFATPVLLCQTL